MKCDYCKRTDYHGRHCAYCKKNNVRISFVSAKNKWVCVKCYGEKIK